MGIIREKEVTSEVRESSPQDMASVPNTVAAEKESAKNKAKGMSPLFQLRSRDVRIKNPIPDKLVIREKV